MITAQIQLEGPDDSAEAAAAVAAVLALLAAEAAVAASPTARSRWRESGRLIAQGLVASRAPALPGWATIERLRRAGRGGGGITGM